MKKRTPDDNLKRVLFISYHFPPDASVGGLRQVKFIKYLTQLGWTPSVLTIQDHYRGSSDTTMLSELKQVRIEKTSKLLGVQELYLRSKRFGLARLKNRFLSTPETKDGGRSLNP